MKHATNGEVLLFKRPIEQKFSGLGSCGDIFTLTENEVIDFEFISNPQAIQTSVKNTFGYVRSRNSSGTNSVGSVTTGPPRQPPISRPTSSNSSNSSSAPSAAILNSLMNNVASTSSLSNDLAQGIAATLAASNGGSQQPQNSHHSTVVGNGLKEFLLEQQHLQHSRPFSNGLGGHHVGSGMNNNSFDNGSGLGLSKRFSSPPSLGPLGNLGDLSASLNPYEKWSNGSDKLFDHHTNDSILDLSSKLLSLGHQSAMSSSSHGNLANGLNSSGNNVGSSSTPNGFPPKSQIKRQKMVYHCKFGEFGVLEGQFTEPSGVAVNAQNDIVVADTNNHRIQIFDKEGRFKFQFGECGKRDGQLLYPNRVAVVKSSGDIIVTERSPTHQVQ